MKYYGVEGHSDLARDPNNNSIVNVNDIEYNQYITRRNIKTEKNQKMQNIEEEIANVKDDLAEIKLLLKEMINGSR